MTESVLEGVALIAPQRALHRTRTEIVNAVDCSVHLTSSQGVREWGMPGEGGGEGWWVGGVAGAGAADPHALGSTFSGLGAVLWTVWQAPRIGHPRCCLWTHRPGQTSLPGWRLRLLSDFSPFKGWQLIPHFKVHYFPLTGRQVVRACPP